MSSEISNTLDDIKHFLEAPERDLGSVTCKKDKRWVLDLETMLINEREMIYNAGLERIFMEILLNAADNVEESRKMGINPGCIHVKVTPTVILVKNYGRAMTCAQREDGLYNPFANFGILGTSTNFGEKRQLSTVGGRFGIGAKATNIMSEIFEIQIHNAHEKKSYKARWRNNMNPKPEESDPHPLPYNGTESSTTVKWLADFSRFYDKDIEHGMAGKRQYTPDMISSFAKHCADASLTARVPVFFNNVKIDISQGIMQYAKMYVPDLDSRQYQVHTSCDSECILIDKPGKAISFVNSVFNEQGGIHVDTWMRACLAPISERLRLLKYKPKFEFLASHFTLFLSCRLKGVVYVAQTKDKIENPQPTVLLDPSYPSTSRWNITEKLIEYCKRNREDKGNKKRRQKNVYVPNLIEASEAGGKDSYKCVLYITEGKSAGNVVAKGAPDGRYIGSLSIKGKLVNVSGKSNEQIDKNAEIKSIVETIGLKRDKDYSDIENRKKLRYGKMMVLTDQDKDGMHIRGLIFRFISEQYPSLLHGEDPFVEVMETPLYKLTYGNESVSLYYAREYLDWVNKNPNIHHRLEYYKGLGSSGETEVIEMFAQKRIVRYKWDENASMLMAIAFDKSKGYSGQRKEWLETWDPEKLEGAHASKFPSNTMSHFVCNQLCEFSYYNVQRTIPSIVDGLKTCQRKIMYVAMKLKHTDKVKVAQLIGRIADETHYQHGEHSLYRAIVQLVNWCVGTNNLPLLNSHGQYDSRQGQVASKDRYIFTSPVKILSKIIRKEDNIILEYQKDGELKIEPKHYYPIIPIFAVNKVCGIGSGYSVGSPAHDPLDVINYVLWWLHTNKGSCKDERPELPPKWFGYKGRMFKKGEKWYSEGSYEIIKSNKKIPDIRITELPVTTTIDTYMNLLKEMKETPIDKNDPKLGTIITGYRQNIKNERYKYKGMDRIEVIPDIIVEGASCLEKQDHKGVMKALRLTEKVADTNIVFLDQNGKPTVFNRDIRIAIDRYCEIRYNAYIRRIKTTIKSYLETINYLELKIKYINDVTNGVFSFKDGNRIKTKKELINDLQGRYPESMLDIKQYQMCQDGIDKIHAEIKSLRESIESYKKTSPAAMWAKELDELKKHL